MKAYLVIKSVYDLLYMLNIFIPISIKKTYHEIPYVFNFKILDI